MVLSEFKKTSQELPEKGDYGLPPWKTAAIHAYFL